MKQIWILARQGIRYRKKETGRIAATIAIAVFFLTAVLSIAGSFVYTSKEQQKDSYGEQMMLLRYNSEDAQKELENASFLEKRGAYWLSAIATEANGSYPVGVGYMDQAGMEIGRIHLAEGRMPKQNGEIAVEKAAVSRLSLPPVSVGQELTLSLVPVNDEAVYTYTFQVVGLVENYTAGWNNLYLDGMIYDAVSETRASDPELFGMTPISCFVTEADSKRICLEREANFLMDTTLPNLDAVQMRVKDLATARLNTAVYPQFFPISSVPWEVSNAIGLAAFVVILILVLIFGLVMNAFFMSIDRRKSQFALLRSVGATKKQAGRVLYCEAIQLYLIGAPVGAVLGLPGSWFCVKGFSSVSGISMRYCFYWWILPLVLLLIAGCILLSVWLPTKKAKKISLIQSEAVKRKRNMLRISPKGKLSPLRLMFLSLRHHKLKIAIAAISFAVCFALLNGMFVAQKYVFGYWEEKQSPNYELQVKEGGIWCGTLEQEPVYPLDLEKQIASILPTESVIHHLTPYFYLYLMPEQHTSYFQNLLNSRPLSVPFGFELEGTPVQAATAMLDDQTLTGLEPYVTEGKINLNALHEGKEIILNMSDYGWYQEVDGKTGATTTETGSGERLKSIMSKKGAILYQNDAIHAGDTVRFITFQPDKEFETCKPEEQKSHIKMIEKTVRIGAIVEELPKRYYGIQPTGGMIVAKDALEKIGLQAKTEKYSIFAKEGLDTETTDQAIRDLAEEENLRAVLLTEQIEQEQKQIQLIRVIISMIVFVVGLLGVVGIINTAFHRMQNRRREICMLRSVGMTKGQMVRMFAYEGILYGVLAVVLGAGLLTVYFRKIVEIQWLQYASATGILLTSAGGIVLCVLAVLLSAKTAEEKNLVKGLRMLD